MKKHLSALIPGCILLAFISTTPVSANNGFHSIEGSLQITRNITTSANNSPSELIIEAATCTNLLEKNIFEPDTAGSVSERTDDCFYYYDSCTTQTDYYGPQYGIVFNLKRAVSKAMDSFGFSDAQSSTVPSAKVSYLKSDREAKVVTTNHWYRIIDKSSGDFIRYRCEYVAGTYARHTDGSWIYLGSAKGEYESHEIQ